MESEFENKIIELVDIEALSYKELVFITEIILNLDIEIKEPMLELGRKIENNSIDKINFIIEAHKKTELLKIGVTKKRKRKIKNMLSM